ncbi:SDR family NAD(P)-dependent oxidoreductase [Frigidibacter sp. MR17.24]|uniref:SDR family NAD(P)-dependent oxidoreductase n=1 Tax=Frigidibacter sp. MR17.24 TaxID=3127345 RepID=UPI003012B9BB
MSASLVIGASGGIGGALARALAARGPLTALSRRDDGLDVTDEASVARLLGALDGPYDLVICATGALGTPEKALRALEPDAFLDQMRVNALGPLLVLKHALRLMPRDRVARFGALSARVGSIGDNRLGGWYSYRAAKAALNQGLRSAAVEVARTHPQAVIAALHPGTVDTGFTAGFAADKHDPDRAAADLLRVLDGLGPAQSGCFRDWRGDEIAW